MGFIFNHGSPSVYGIFGDPIEHSLSPLMHNYAFQALKINGVYLPFRIDKDHITTAVNAIRVLGFAGVNVTVPYKNAVAPLLDSLEGDAALTGSVNTIHHIDGRLIGYSTDGIGFMRSLREEASWDPAGQSVIILGTGGAAAAIAFRLIKEGVDRLLILSRNEVKSLHFVEQLYDKLGFRAEMGHYAKPNIADLAKQFSLVVNTTPLGLAGRYESEQPPFEPQWTSPHTLFYDLIYNPMETPWLRKAALLNRRSLSGLGMLLFQGAESFRIWTGMEMPTQEIHRILMKDVQKR